jgi:hypothetical protein
VIRFFGKRRLSVSEAVMLLWLSAQVFACHLLNAIRGLQAWAKIQPSPTHL